MVKKKNTENPFEVGDYALVLRHKFYLVNAWTRKKIVAIECKEFVGVVRRVIEDTLYFDIKDRIETKEVSSKIAEAAIDNWEDKTFAVNRKYVRFPVPTKKKWHKYH